MKHADRFAVLARLFAHHTYYADGVCTDLVFRPTVSTSAALRRLGLLLRASPGGFDLLFQPGRWLGRELRGLPPFLDFSLQPRTNEFVNFTELPESMPPALLYFRAGSGQEALTAKSVELRPLAFEISFAGAERSGALAARDALGRDVWSLELSGARRAIVDLRANPAGRYSLSLDGALFADLYADDSLYREPALGVAGIEMKSLAAIAVRPAEAPAVYVLSFEARATLWRYNILGVSTAEAKTLEVVDTAGEFWQCRRNLQLNEVDAPRGRPRRGRRFRFSYGGSRRLSDGRTAQLFQAAADTPIPLRAAPDYRFSLVRKPDWERQVLIAQLPYPSLTLTGAANGRFVSDIYVQTRSGSEYGKN